MFGSLVVIYPTLHEGGELIFRHKNQEWKFDANSLIVSQPSPSIAYVAFYSDIEHEVLKVTRGCRVAVTYNLYLVDPRSKVGAPVHIPSFKGVSSLQATLRELLNRPEFLPDGGTLGFGLTYLYPVTFKTKLQEMTSYLKGTDAHVYQACLELHLQPSLKVIYDDNESHGGETGIMLDRIAKEPNYGDQEWSYEYTLVMEFGGVPVNKTESATLERSTWVAQWESEGEFITWVSPFNGQNRSEDTTVAYGNEPSMGYIYCRPCIIVRIAAAYDRVP